MHKMIRELLCIIGRHQLSSYTRVRLGNRYFHAANCYESDHCRGKTYYFNESIEHKKI